MKLTKQQKRDLARQLAETYKNSSVLYFTQYQGLKFIELHQLRAKLKPLACRYRVVKNSLVANALKEAGIGGAQEGLLKGPVGLVTGEAGQAPAGLGPDPIAAAKALAAFAKEFPLLKVKAGYVERRWLGPAECARLSTLGTRPEMLALLAGTFRGALAQAAGLLQAPLAQFALLLKALQDKQAGESPAAA